MATNIETIEDGVLISRQTHQNRVSSLKSRNLSTTKWLFLSLYCMLSAVGTICGPLLLRLYFLNGGNRKWITSWLQSAGFPLLILPLIILYLRQRSSGIINFLAPPKLMLFSILIGFTTGLDNFMYSKGLASIPVSTSSLLLSTQLVSTALLAFIMVKQKFTPYSINAIILMTLGSIMLGIRKNGDRPPGVTSNMYLLGFFLTLGAAGLLGFIFPCTEVAYGKVNKAITYSMVLQFQLGCSFFATVFCTIGMLINKDFEAIPREANEFALGPTKYYLILIASAIVWQMLFVGALGIIFCASSLFAGVVSATLLPFTEIAGVIVFHEKFTGEKGIALVLCLWGFTSYFYGSYKENKKQTPPEPEPEPESK